MEAFAEDEQGKIIDIGRPAPVADVSIRQLADSINADWRGSVEGILRAARQLAEAKESRPEPIFEMLLESLDFGRRTAGRLICIGRSRLLSDGTRASQLPNAWTTLYALSRMPEPQLQAALDAEWVHADLERSEVPAVRRQADRAVGAVERKTLRPRRVPFAKELARMLTREVVAWIDGLSDRERREFVHNVANHVLQQKHDAERSAE